jgi:long-subunit acyl-CoA synthetase (AMP-forming)
MGMNEGAPLTLLHRFLHWEHAQPHAVYFTQPYPDGRVEDYTWKEVGSQARRMAAHLRSLRLPARSNIAILGKNSAHWIIADLAIWMAGHTSVPLYPTMNGENARYILAHADVRLLFAGKLDGRTDGWNEIRKVLPPQMPVIGLPMSPPMDAPQWDALIADQRPLLGVHLPAPGDLATIIYTSGTTGTPKGVMHSFGNFLTYARTMAEFCAYSSSDRLLSYLPLAHAAERAFVEANSLQNGLRVYFNDSLETFAQDLRRARPTVFISMPRLWTRFYAGACSGLTPALREILKEHSPASDALKKQVLVTLGLEACRLAFTGSAPLPAEIVDWYRNLGLELLDVYGMTEDCAYSHYSRPGQVRLGYVGQALPGVQSRIGADGEVLVKSPSRMMGYYRQPELSAESTTADGFFRTGDRGEFDEMGRLKITGRVKELFKTSKGKWVSPGPIEIKLTHPTIEAACVAGYGERQPFALLRVSADARKELEDPGTREPLQAELEHLLDSVNSTLEDHEKLSFAVVVKDLWSIENGFLTPTMKIRRSVIEERYKAKAQAWAELGRTVLLESD